MQMLVLTWRRGLPLCLALAVSLPATYVGRWDQWLGVWSETQNYVGIAFIFGVPAASAAGAWVGAQNARGGVSALQAGASASPICVAVRELGEPVVWIWAGFVLACTPAYVATALTADVGHPRPLPIVAQLACLGGMTTLGHLAGTRMPWYLGAPVCAAAAYVLLGFLSFNADRLLLSLTPVDERWMTFHHIIWWVLVLQALLWTLVIAAVVLRRAALPRAASGALVAAGLAAAPLLYVTPATRAVTASDVEMACTTEADTTICLPRAKSELEGALMAQASRGLDLLEGLLPSEVAFIDDEARGVSPDADRSINTVTAEQHRQGRVLVFFSEAGDLSARTQLSTDQFHYGLIAALIPASPVDVGDTEPGGEVILPTATPTDAIYRWYLTALDVPVDGSGGAGAPLLDDRYLDYSQHAADIDAFEGMDAVERASWFESHTQSLRDGTVEWSDFATIER
ncbi:hypothetical protein [Nocardioides plantarum]|uniref:Uncharacterized protein n=1 Tax=Nocardioides plantarum TaxID=29299 RepID=A0ABV5KF23_9ACTN|nr:hypothetical protein [Nocardioides plantarum]